MRDVSQSKNANNQQDIVIFHFPSSILKDECVSHISVYDDSCNHCVNTNSSDAPISKNLLTTMSIILNNVIGFLKRVFQYLIKNSTVIPTNRYIPIGGK